MKHLVFLLEEPSAKDLLEGLLPRLLPKDMFVYYLVFESPFLYEWRVAVPMQYFLLPFAARTMANLLVRASGRRLEAGRVRS